MKYQLIFILVLVGCAGPGYFDRDRNSPVYQRGGDLILVPHIPVRSIISSRSKTEPTETPVPSTQELSQTQALSGLVLSGLSLATNKDYYRSSFLSGRCVCHSPKEKNFEIPCSNVNVILEDQKGRVVSRHLSMDGTFSFPVSKKVQYKLRALSSHYKEMKAPKSWYQMGDDVVLHLVTTLPLHKHIQHN